MSKLFNAFARFNEVTGFKNDILYMSIKVCDSQDDSFTLDEKLEAHRMVAVQCKTELNFLERGGVLTDEQKELATKAIGEVLDELEQRINFTESN